MAAKGSLWLGFAVRMADHFLSSGFFTHVSPNTFSRFMKPFSVLGQTLKLARRKILPRILARIAKGFEVSG